MPSEFKQLWEELTKNHLVDAFSDYLEDYKKFKTIVQASLKSVYEEIEITRNKIILKISEIFKLDINEENNKLIFIKFLPFFQDNSKSIFPNDNNWWATIEKTLLKENEIIFSELNSNPDFKKCLIHVHRMCLHMVLNDPQIYFSLSDEFEYHKFDRLQYYCIDGFPKDNTPCVVVLDYPRKENDPYLDIKKSILILNDPSEEIIELISNPKVLKNNDKQEMDSIEILKNNCDKVINISIKLDDKNSKKISPEDKNQQLIESNLKKLKDEVKDIQFDLNFVRIKENCPSDINEVQKCIKNEEFNSKVNSTILKGGSTDGINNLSSSSRCLNDSQRNTWNGRYLKYIERNTKASKIKDKNIQGAKTIEKKDHLIKREEILSNNFNSIGNKNLDIKKISCNIKSPIPAKKELSEIYARFCSNENKNKEKSISLNTISSPNFTNVNQNGRKPLENSINVCFHRNKQSLFQNNYTKVEKSSREINSKYNDSPSKMIKINDEYTKMKSNFISKIQSINKKLLQYKNALLDPKQNFANSGMYQVSINT